MAIKTNKAIKISQKHLLGIQDLSINDVNLIIDEASAFINLNKSNYLLSRLASRLSTTNIFVHENLSRTLKYFVYKVALGSRD